MVADAHDRVQFVLRQCGELYPRFGWIVNQGKNRGTVGGTLDW
jgi:hypothetical protein